MQEKIIEIAARVRELRELSDFTVKDVAEYLQISDETYENYENGSEDIPASMLFELAHKLRVDMATLLTGEEPRMNVFTVTRDGKGVSVERRKQYRYQNLAEKFIHKKAEFFIVSVEPRSSGAKPETNSHPGQEFNYVLEGSLKVYIHHNEIVLNKGDSIYFDSTYEHAMEALEGEPARFLAVII
ncbi:cupin domain-containing protein [Methanosarcina sp. MSH10X1]|uniref:helix-turn-helix domain-containing protein n=1 Tax=Methanosarcina sp. MSH10X1 TaxID=2507075 RepID=UPI000FFC915C|nr:cupin domain-containing protein [Methanosarcina sp. MSH10X1]RXA21816.1 cupin domain-containing protein [Methanosarcina sp. MSH10X1]